MNGKIENILIELLHNWTLVEIKDKWNKKSLECKK